MVFFRRTAVVIALLALAVASAAWSRGHGHRGSSTQAGRFDYWLMSLSWSPSYCLTHPDDERQCQHKGYGFVLHGLWPQSRNGYGPQHCSTQAEPDEATIQHALAFMPSRRLIEHEWETHGTCSGLDPSAYFELADRAFASVKTPSSLTTPRSPPTLSANEVVQAFARANPGLGANMLSVVCQDGGTLNEVRVCLNRDTLAPQACSGRVRNTCRAGALKIPAAR
ncbi:MAG: ribonuclease T2 [Proteobacteria bacterium]|nr:ribonuclease T2 [Pseudomonadota bacterium]